MSRLEMLVEEARAAERPAFDVARGLGSALAKKAQRERRQRTLRRVSVGVSGAALFALLLFRASVAPASGSASASTPATSAASGSESPRQEIAARALDDAGYACD